MALPHLKSGQVADLKPFGSALAQSRSHALFKSADLEVARLVLHAGEGLPPHSVAGEITVQCIEGRVAFHCDAGMQELQAGQLIHLRGEETHALRALEDSSLLLTIALKHEADSGPKR